MATNLKEKFKNILVTINDLLKQNEPATNTPMASKFDLSTIKKETPSNVSTYTPPTENKSISDYKYLTAKPLMATKVDLSTIKKEEKPNTSILGKVKELLTPKKETVLNAPLTPQGEQIVKNLEPIPVGTEVKLPFLQKAITIPTDILSGQIKGITEWPEKTLTSLFYTFTKPLGTVPKRKEQLYQVPTYQEDLQKMIDSGVPPLIAFGFVGSQAMLDTAVGGQLIESGAKAVLKNIAPKFEEIEAARTAMGLPKNFTEIQRQKVYMDISKKVHPDVAGGSNVLMKKLNQANQILKASPNYTAVEKGARKVAETLVKPFGAYPTAEPFIATKGLLPTRTGQIPTQPYVGYKPTYAGLSLKEIKEKPIIQGEEGSVKNQIAFQGSKMGGGTKEVKLNYDKVLTFDNSQMDVITQLANQGSKPAQELLKNPTDFFVKADKIIADEYKGKYDAMKYLNKDRPQIGIEYRDLKNSVSYAEKKETANVYAMQNREAKYPKIISEEPIKILELPRANNKGVDNYYSVSENTYIHQFIDENGESKGFGIGKIENGKNYSPFEKTNIAGMQMSQAKSYKTFEDALNSAKKLSEGKLKNIGESGTNTELFNQIESQLIKGVDVKKYKNLTNKISEVQKAGEKVMEPSAVSTVINNFINKERPNIKMYGETPGLEPVKRPISLRKLGVQPPMATKITKPEDVLLRGKLRQQEKGSKLGYKVGAIETRTKILEQLKVKQTELKDIKKQIIDYVKDNIPTQDRGKFINMINNTNTQESLIKSFIRVDKEIENIAKGNLIGDIKKNVSKILESKQIAVDYKDKINDVMSGVEIPGHRQTTLDRIKKTKDYLEKQKELGNDVFMPEKVLESLDILNRKPLNKMSLVELELLSDKLAVIEQLGKTKLRTIQNLYDIEKQKIKDELLVNTFPIESREIFKPKVGENITFEQKFKNIFSKALNEAQRVDLAITPMDTFFDMLDGFANYVGSNSKNFKKKLDGDFGGYLSLKDKFGTESWKWAEDLKLNDENFNRIGIHAIRAQEGGKEKLSNLGYTEEDINKIILTENEMKFYSTMRKNLDSLRPLIADVMKNVYNESVGDVKNYFSFITDWDAMNDVEVYRRIRDTKEYGMPTKKTEMGFTKARTGVGKQKIKINAMDVYLNHVDNATYLISMAKDIKMLFEISNSPEYGLVAGDRGQKIVVEWLDLMSRKGGGNGAIQIKFLDTLRKNIGSATLGFRISSALMQPTALFDGATMIGNYAFRGVNNILVGEKGKEWRYFLKDNFPELRDRGLDDPAFLEFAENKLLAKIQKIGFQPLGYLDKITASAITSGAYEKYLDEHNIPLDFNKPNFEAISYAEKILRKTQASPLFKDIPLAISKGALTGIKSVDKIILQFQNFMLNRWSLIRHDLYGTGLKLPDPFQYKYKTKDKDFKKAFNIFFWLTIANITALGIRRGVKKLMDFLTGSESPKNTFTKDIIMEMLTTIPFVSQGVSMAVYDREPMPVYDVSKTLIKEGYASLTGVGKKVETKIRHWINFMSAITSLRGIPGSSQLRQFLIGQTYPETKKSTKLEEMEKRIKKVQDNEKLKKYEDRIKKIQGK